MRLCRHCRRFHSRRIRGVLAPLCEGCCHLTTNEIATRDDDDAARAATMLRQLARGGA